MTLETLTLAKKICPHWNQSLCLFSTLRKKDFLDRTEKQIGTDNNWEAHVAQQIPLPRTSSPGPTSNQLGSLEQVETFTEDDMDIREFSERPANDMRPPKSPRKTKAYIQDSILPLRCADYMVMNHMVMDIPKPPLPEIKSLLTEEEKNGSIQSEGLLA